MSTGPYPENPDSPFVTYPDLTGKFLSIIFRCIVGTQQFFMGGGVIFRCPDDHCFFLCMEPFPSGQQYGFLPGKIFSGGKIRHLSVMEPEIFQMFKSGFPGIFFREGTFRQEFVFKFFAECFQNTGRQEWIAFGCDFHETGFQ